MHFDTIYRCSILLAALSLAPATVTATTVPNIYTPSPPAPTSPPTQSSSSRPPITPVSSGAAGSQGSSILAKGVSAWSVPPSPSYCTSTVVHPLKPPSAGETASRPPQAQATDGYGWESLTSLFPEPTGGYGWQSEEGHKWGQVVIHNHCDETFNLTSVGAWKLGGPKIRTTYGGLGSPCDDIQHVLKAGEFHREYFRITCSTPRRVLYPGNQYCADEDKLSGQGISIKITSGTKKNAGQTQFEYALMQDPNRGESGDAFKRLNYDISLLDCGNNGLITDSSGNKSEHDNKIEMCPGYRDGMAVTFPHDGEDTTNCPPIYCDGKEKCDMIYTWDRTRQGEASLACEREYKGEMRVDLCVGRSPEQKIHASSLFKQWYATATEKPFGYYNATSVPSAVKPKGNSTSVSAPITSAPIPSSFSTVVLVSTPLGGFTNPSTAQVTVTVTQIVTTLVTSTLTSGAPRTRSQVKKREISTRTIAFRNICVEEGGGSPLRTCASSTETATRGLWL